MHAPSYTHARTTLHTHTPHTPHVYNQTYNYTQIRRPRPSRDHRNLQGSVGDGRVTFPLWLHAWEAVKIIGKHCSRWEHQRRTWVFSGFWWFEMDGTPAEVSGGWQQRDRARSFIWDPPSQAWIMGILTRGMPLETPVYSGVGAFI